MDYAVNKYRVDEAGDKSEDRNKYKDDITHGVNGNKRSHKKDKTSDVEDEEAAANIKKSNKEKRNNFIEDEVDPGHGTRSKITNKKDRRSDGEANEKDSSSNTKSRRIIKNKYGLDINRNASDKKNSRYEIVNEAAENNERNNSSNINSGKGIKDNSGDKTKHKRVKKYDELDQKRDGIKIKKGRGFDDKNESNVETTIKSGKRIDGFHKTKNDNREHGLDKKREAGGNKQEWNRVLNEKVIKGDSHAPDKSRKHMRSIAETKVPEKYLNWLLKVSRSAGENMNIDTLMFPHVVFAQGDTYFSLSKFTENYSLI